MTFCFYYCCLNKVHAFVSPNIEGGDGWVKDSPKVDGIPSFRESFSRELNYREDVPIINIDSVGNATSRPLGTKFENTSFAHIHKNALFVTVDAFHDTGSDYFDREKSEGGHGIITCTVVGDHLAWFENVLRAGRELLSIKHIFVQAHIPILQPVRKSYSSGQYFDGADSSDFWKLMQKYDVDVYFAGEVHANTVIKDSHSNTIQVTSRANRLNNFLRVDVSEDKYIIHSYNEIGEKWRWNGNYTNQGQLTVNKSNGAYSISGIGSLEPIDLSSLDNPLIWLKFGESDKYKLKDRQIVGLKYDQFQQTLEGHSITIRNITSTEGMKNFGLFGRKFFLCVLH